MDLLTELEQDLAYHFSEKLEYPIAKPHWVYLSLSHQCTYRCQMCRVVRTSTGTELETPVVTRLLDEISRWAPPPTVMLTGGEPFLRKDLFSIISHSVLRGLPTEIVSNGALIDKDTAERIVSAGLKNIAISIDGAEKTTHDAIREPGAFEKAVRALSFLVQAKKRAGSGIQISIWTTIMKENAGELSRIVSLATELGVDCLVFHPVVVVQDDMQNTSAKGPFWVRGKEIGALESEIKKLVDYQRKNGLIAFLHDPHLWLKFFDGTLTKKEWKCNPFVFVSVSPDGEVRSCGAGFGNIHGAKLEETLTTDLARRARREMSSCNKPCLQTCWAMPRADSLEKIIDDFILKVRAADSPEKEKKELLKHAAARLEAYENLVKEKCMALKK